MKKRILWIEDDYYALQGLVRPLEKEGFTIDVATSALDGFEKALKWRHYDLIIVDLILPLSNTVEDLPDKVRSWAEQEYVGIGLVKWLRADLKAGCPVLLLSVVREPMSRLGLQDLGLAGHLVKRGLLPSQVRDEVFRVLKIEEIPGSE